MGLSGHFCHNADVNGPLDSTEQVSILFRQFTPCSCPGGLYELKRHMAVEVVLPGSSLVSDPVVRFSTL